MTDETSISTLPSLPVLKSPITALRFNEQMFAILRWARKFESRVVCVANVHMVMEAFWDLEFASVLEKADVVTPDGMPLVWMLRKMGAPYQDRVAGMDIFSKLCSLAQHSHIKVFFLGSQFAILEKIRERLTIEFPNLQIAGMEPLPFRPLTQSEDEAVVRKLNNSGAGIVFVSLGCPKQEKWMAQHRGKVKAVMIGLGAVFPVYAGLFKRAPRYVREAGMEWFYRLLQEPQRLWGRYTQTIPPFVWLAARQLLMQPKASQQAIAQTSLTSQSLSTKALLSLSSFQFSSAKIGEILVRQNLLSPETLKLLLAKQQGTERKLGEILVEKGLISQLELQYHLTNQQIKLGEVLVLNGVISKAQLAKVLKKQSTCQQMLGELLLKRKLLTVDQLVQFLKEQYWRRQGLWLVTNPTRELANPLDVNGNEYQLIKFSTGQS